MCDDDFSGNNNCSRSGNSEADATLMEVLRQVRDAIVARIAVVHQDGEACACDDDTVCSLAALQEPLATACKEANDCEDYMRVFGNMRYGQILHVDLHVEELVRVLTTNCGCESVLLDLHRVSSLDALCTREDVASLTAFLQTMVKQAELARATLRMDEHELQRAIDDAEDELRCARRLRVVQAKAARRRQNWDKPRSDPSTCPELRCTRSHLCDECTRARRKHRLGRRFVDHFIRTHCTPLSSLNETRDEGEDDRQTNDSNGDGANYDSDCDFNYDADVDECTDKRTRQKERRVAQLHYLSTVVRNMHDTIERTLHSYRCMHANAANFLATASYINRITGLVTMTPERDDKVASPKDGEDEKTLDTLRTQLRLELHNLHNYARQQNTNRPGALQSYYYMDTYRRFQSASIRQCEQTALLQIAAHSARREGLSTLRLAIQSLVQNEGGNLCALLDALAFVDVVRSRPLSP